MTWVWEHGRAQGADLLLLLAIADCADDTGRNAWPSTATLARKTRVSDRTVQRMITRLVTAGALEVEPNAGPRGTNRFTVVMREPDTAGPPAPQGSPHVHRDPRQIDGGVDLTPRQPSDGGTPDSMGVGGTSLNVLTPPSPREAGGDELRSETWHCRRHSRRRRSCPTCQAGPPAPPPPWCGQCDSDEHRFVTLEDSRVGRCPRCNPRHPNVRVASSCEACDAATITLDVMVLTDEEPRRITLDPVPTVHGRYVRIEYGGGLAALELNPDERDRHAGGLLRPHEETCTARIGVGA